MFCLESYELLEHITIPLISVSIKYGTNLCTNVIFTYYIPAAPRMPIPSIDLNTVHRTSDGIDVTFNFILSWTEPFANFDPIRTYMISIACTGSGCPVNVTTDNVTNSFNVSYTTPLAMVNATIMVTANNIVGISEPGVLDIVGRVSLS